MAVLPGPVAGSADEPAFPLPDETTHVPETLRRADGVVLLGEMVGSGYREPPALARRADGQVVALTPLLHLLLSTIDGERTVDEVAARASEADGRTITADNVRTLVDGRLRPSGLVLGADGEQPEQRRANPLLALRFKYAVTDPERTRRITGPFAALFAPVIVAAVLVAFAVVCWWVFWEKGLASGTFEAFDRPVLLLLVFAVTVFSAGFHEFGHAAAARRGGATPGAMGAGVYLVWPAFYTDVTDSYRLGRVGRLRTDLGGLYFNAIVAVVIAGLWWATGYDALLLVVATQILQMLRQLTPLVRFDGYHVLADLTGVPDLFHRIGPTLRGLLPWRWREGASSDLKPWARAVVSVWVLVVVPVLAFSLYLLVTTLPRLLGTAWRSLGAQVGMLTRGWSDGDVVEVAVRAVAVLAVVFPILAIAVLLSRVGRSAAVATWQRTSGRPVLRAVAALLVVVLLAGLTWAWWPRPGAYRPVQPWEGGTLRQAGASFVSSLKPQRGTRLVAGQYGRMAASWPLGEARPTAARPQLALVLVPRGYDTTAGRPGTAPGANPATGPGGGPGGGVGTGGAAAPGGGSTGPAWVFPFNKPPAPGPGGNQAMAVNTTDGTVAYDVAFALVWVEGDAAAEPALNRNEAYAFASCTGCAAVAVGFQVVLVTGENRVAAPQNISAAANADCVNCTTYALADQLFITLDGPLSPAATRRLTELWAEIDAFGRRIAEIPVSEIQQRLDTYQRQIVQIIEADQGPLTPPGAGPGVPGAVPTPTVTSGPSASVSRTSAATSSAPPPSGGAGPASPAVPIDPATGASGSTSVPPSTPSSAPTSGASAGSGADAPATTSASGG